MPPVPHPDSNVSPALKAGLLLAAISLLRALRLPHPTVAQVLKATGASRTWAYVLRDNVFETLPNLERPVGRPPAPSPAELTATVISREVLHFVMAHPGCVSRGKNRQRYSEDFQCFIIERHQQHAELDLASFAEAVNVPAGTLKDWLRGGRAVAAAAEPVAPKHDTTAADPKVDTSRLETLLNEWERWNGGFINFCDHVWTNLHIPYKRTIIANILEKIGVRIPKRRPGRSPDEKALRGAFETFFPGAQWQGDGSAITVTINGQTFTFNIEPMVDAHTGAFCGVSVRDTEDSAAVIDAFNDGVETTGTPPLGLLLDGRPSNHTDQVHQATGDTLIMRGTPGRAQNRPHVEGGFGLFKQTAPLLFIVAESTRELARQILELIAQTWARTLNNKPRAGRSGRSRVEQYKQETPTEEEIAEARAALEERCRKHLKALKTTRARQDPVVRQTLDDAFGRLGLDDPTGNIRSAIARYSLDDIVASIATFEGKHNAGTLPDGVDGRYLLGIVRNIAQQDEGLAISEALLRARLAAKDCMLAHLQAEHDWLVAQSGNGATDVLKAFLGKALDTDRHLDRLYWLQKAAGAISAQPVSRHTALLDFGAIRIHAAFQVKYTNRLAAVRYLARKVLPLT